jgi:C-22 sterol desaturase
MAAVPNASVVQSMLADNGLSQFAAAEMASPVDNVFATASRTMSPWTVVATILALIVAYDQFSYQWNKGCLEGPRFKLPILGPFFESVNPKFSAYHAKWMSGPLSCVSVFHKSVVVYSRTRLHPFPSALVGSQPVSLAPGLAAHTTLEPRRAD